MCWRHKRIHLSGLATTVRGKEEHALVVLWHSLVRKRVRIATSQPPSSPEDVSNNAELPRARLRYSVQRRGHVAYSLEWRVQAVRGQ